jgi:hypothetical protein
MSERQRYERAWKRAGELGVQRQLAELVERAVDTMARAAADYDYMHWGDDPDGIVVAEAPLVLPGESLAELGELEIVEYSASKGGRHYQWWHEFEGEKPRLCVTEARELVVVGGSYTVTERGIVG